LGDDKSADLASLRQQIGVVLQEDFLFNGSMENITLGNPDITAEQVEAAAVAAVMNCPKVTKPMSERGTALSGGQQQHYFSSSVPLSNTDFDFGRSH